VSNRTREEKMQRFGMLLQSSTEVISDYRDVLIEEYHETLEGVKDPGDFRFVQGQIAGVRDFCTLITG